MTITVTIPNALLTLRQRFDAALAASLATGRDVLAAFVTQSLRARWYRTGFSIRNYLAQAIQRRNGGRIQVVSGAPYDAFGEYGTGRRGAASGVTDRPASWRYGTVAGMTARRQFTRGLEAASPAIVAAINRRMQSFASGEA